MSDSIKTFRDEYAFLSNFHPAWVEFEGVRYRSVEHAFQAAKTLNPVEREAIHRCPTAGQAKRAGHRVHLRPGWDGMKDGIMLDLLRTKFKDPELAEKLLATEYAELIEGNWWGDQYWGVSNGRGLNVLGQLLMRVRDELDLYRSLAEREAAW